VKPGERLGDRFEIEQSIGIGGMGTVFRACDPTSGETVAVKVIATEQGDLTGRFT
jgi:eukaryotic-like serine/threonine-protein kinase